MGPLPFLLLLRLVRVRVSLTRDGRLNFLGLGLMGFSSCVTKGRTDWPGRLMGGMQGEGRVTLALEDSHLIGLYVGWLDLDVLVSLFVSFVWMYSIWML